MTQGLSMLSAFLSSRADVLPVQYMQEFALNLPCIALLRNQHRRSRSHNCLGSIGVVSSAATSAWARANTRAENFCSRKRLTMTENQRGLGTVVQIIWILAGLLVIAALSYHFIEHNRESKVAFATPYQAILLANGSVYFGHLQDYGSAHPVLTDVYYIVTQTNPETKQSNNVLVKRGKELHAPDRMYINPSQLIFVEPVGENSKVAELIRQAKQ